MKDPSGELITAIFDALDGNVSYASIDTPVYTMPVEWEDRPCNQYIRIAEINWEETGPKDTNITEGRMDLYVDTFFTGKSSGSKVPMNSIANQVSQLIDQKFTLASYTMVMGRVESMEDLDYTLDPQGVVFEKLITYSFIIEEV